MSHHVTRTGVKSFTIANDDPSEPWSLLEADYSVDPPLLKYTFRHLWHAGESWAFVDAELLKLE